MEIMYELIGVAILVFALCAGFGFFIYLTNRE